MDYKQWAEEMNAEILRVIPILGGMVWSGKPMDEKQLRDVWHGLRSVQRLHTPYPGHCINPDECRGMSCCPRNYSCVE